jgi:hypothetical protein
MLSELRFRINPAKSSGSMSSEDHGPSSSCILPLVGRGCGISQSQLNLLECFSTPKKEFTGAVTRICPLKCRAAVKEGINLVDFDKLRKKKKKHKAIEP